MPPAVDRGALLGACASVDTAARGYPNAPRWYDPARDGRSDSDRRLRGHVPLRGPLSCSRATCASTTWTRARATRRRCCCSTATPPGATCTGARSQLLSSQRGPPLRGVRPHGLRPLGQAAAASPLRRSRNHIDNALALIDELDLRDVTLVAHDWGGPIGLGALLRARDRLRALVLMNTWAWELPSFLPGFLRQFRTDGLGEILALARQHVGGVDPRRHGPARHRPGDDGRLPGALPRLLVAPRHARVPARRCR